MINIYCISGLGADHRIFQRLSIPGVQLVPVAWPSFSATDTITIYAQKVSATISEDNPVILGLSFGGMLAVEIAKLRPVKQLILISSAKTVSELPKPNAVVQALLRANLIPSFVFTLPNAMLLHRFGAHTADEKQLMRKIINDSDGQFMKWALHALLGWKNETYPDNLIHIHGTADQIIPPENVHPTHWIKGGTHMMVYNRAAEICDIISRHL